MDKNKGGRPKKYDYEKIAKALNDYIDATDIPVIAAFCYLMNIRRDCLYEMGEKSTELSNAIKRCIEKKEAQLEIKSLKGEINSTQAIFSLKQLGWRDKQEIDQNIGNKDGKPFAIDEQIKELRKLTE